MAVTATDASPAAEQTVPQQRPPEVNRVEELALRLAREQTVAHSQAGAAPLLDRLQDYERLLRAAQQQFAHASREELGFSYVAEWLLDNFYLVQQAIRQIRTDLPPSYYRLLPKLEAGPLARYPRVYAIAREYLRENNALLDVGPLRPFVQSYQTLRPLTTGELWALPIMLLLGLIEYLAAATARVTQLTLPQEAEALAPSLAAGSEDTVVANSITSLRTMVTEDWKDFFEEVSLVEQVLRRDPVAIYRQMDFETRDRYRKVIETLALRTRRDESEVAQVAIEVAREHTLSTSSPRQQHVGYYLIDAGRSVLEARLNYRPQSFVQLQRWLLDRPTLTYLGSVWAITLFVLLLIGSVVVAAGGTILPLVLVLILAVILVLGAAVTLVNWIVTQVLPPSLLPRLEFEQGVPVELSTMIVIPAMLSNREDANSLLRQIEMHYLRNTASNIYFALLTDFADAATQIRPEDQDLLEYTTAGIEALSAKYGTATVQPFFFFHRQRLWNPSEGVWMGWERKRGKLHEFNYLLRGNPATSFIVQVGDLTRLSLIKYVITVDADTIIPRNSALQLIGTLAHPLNQAEIDPESGQVTAGYTVLQPRTQINPLSANRSLFTRIFSGDAGLDLYTLAVSDVYQDLFKEGLYVGKGIYDVDAFELSLRGRIPENSLLSHDLFEGVHGRVGLVTNIVLLEDYPPHYLVHAHRLHRWLRGDWQLLPWLLNLPRVRRSISAQLSVIDRWKIGDNLRRSLTLPLAFTLFLAGWTVLPGSPLMWTVLTLLLLSVPLLTSFVTALVSAIKHNTIGVLRPWRYEVARWFLMLAFMPYETSLTLDAIVATLVRVFITRRDLLKWVTAAHTVRLFGWEVEARVTWRQMIMAPIAVVVLTALIVLVRPAALLGALPLLMVWAVSPSIAYWIGRPLADRVETLSDRQSQQLRVLARRTWLFFERFVGPEDNWLPPDHFQESPRGLPAHRTSPTNIGLLLLSTLSAYDLGYIGSLDLALRVRDTFDTLWKLERYRGHWLNWYDTRSLQPLPPAYVSTVDSGNLAACLYTLKQAFGDLPHTPALRWQRLEGLLDTLDLLIEVMTHLETTELQTKVAELQDYVAAVRQQVVAVQGDPGRWIDLIGQLASTGWDEINRRLLAFVEANIDLLDAEILRSLRLSAERLYRLLESVQREVELLTPWLMTLQHPPALFSATTTPDSVRAAWTSLREALAETAPLGELKAMVETGQARLQWLRERLEEAEDSPLDLAAAQQWCEQLERNLRDARLAVEPLLVGYRDLIEEADRAAREMDFQFLFSSRRKVFHIGYNITAARLDNNFYDLLASEARIASLIAIAKRDVPQSHWLYLARPLTLVAGQRTLLSWSGTMFEYLMPTLFMHSYDGTLLNQSVRAAVDCQIAYGRQKGLPWGVSESAFYHFDAALNYQYRAFGVPALGFKRGLAEDHVIAPYASLMALAVRPKAVVDNLQHLRRLKMLGHFGLYEALDATPARQPHDQKYGVVRAYMAHHQGMILLALVNYLCDEIMVQRLHREPRIQSVELLLQEQIPQAAPVEFPQGEELPSLRPSKPPVNVTGWRVPVETAVPQVQVLSNGHFTTLLTSSGGGYSQWHGLDLTRWHPDTTLDDWGMWLYLQDLDRGEKWSATLQPIGYWPDERNVTYYPHMAEYRTQHAGIDTTLEITVAPDDDVEIRRLTLVNHTDQLRRISVTSYGEVALAAPTAYQRHPAFNKLFIESEYLPHLNALVFRRRLRSSDEKPVFLLHTLVTRRDSKPGSTYETDRLKFVGRGRTLRDPAALERAGGLAGTVGATLDPCLALGQTLELKPHASVQLVYLTLAQHSRDLALNLAQRYRSWIIVEQVFDRARAQSETALRQLMLTSTELQHYQQLLGLLLYPNAQLRSEPALLAANTKGQSGLWAYGISGDYPIVVVQVADEMETASVLELLQAHAYWRSRLIKIDLVILNVRESGYAQPVEDRVQRLLAQTQSERWVNRRGGIFVVNVQQLHEADRTLLYTVARAVVQGGTALREQLANQIDQTAQLPAFMAAFSDQADLEPTPALSRPTDLLFDNDLGGFSADGREYVIYLKNGQRTPLPWINVIANAEFGCLVSEAGGGYTWSLNSGENRLTPWRNDPVSDRPGEALYLRDEETAVIWSPTPLPAGEREPYLIRHGAGYSIFEHHSHGLKQQLTVWVAADAPVKIIRLRLENTWRRPRRITATYYAEWVLGVTRDNMQSYVTPEYHAESHALLARNPYNAEFGEHVAFLAANQPLHGLTADRTEFLGRLGSYESPAALQRIGLTGRVVAGADPCAAIMLHLDLPPSDSTEIYFLLGQGADRAEALQLIKRFQNADTVEQAWIAARQHWDDLLNTVTVRTPDRAMDVLLNRWLLYQALTCRLWGRSALYQSSGAYGFRDQLQDVLAVLQIVPELARAHILEAARHQFEAGDVLHWWHPPSGRGLRTRCSDDLLWLPYVTAQYVTATGDRSILKEEVPFLRALPLESEEEERYGQFESTSEAYPLYEHCRRALKKGSTSGMHRLPLMGTGDWNDGMNRVGSQGQGESVWLGWFLYDCLQQFAPLCEMLDDQQQATAYRQQARALQQVLEDQAWDGAWYRRAFYDDGSPLGSIQNRECQIDSIAQSWAVISRGAQPERARQAMEAVAQRLVREDARLILLFTPPFDRTKRDPGYIKGYLPGIRENGGQYTHAALWATWAFAQLGQGNRAGHLFQLLNPIYHGRTSSEVRVYQTEPYVIAADVYGVPPHSGRGGWTWYTGSASWMYRLGLEAILGVRREGDRLCLNPCIPAHWPGYDVTYRFGTSRYEIHVRNPAGVEHGLRHLSLDGRLLPDSSIPLLDDGQTHEVEIELGPDR